METLTRFALQVRMDVAEALKLPPPLPMFNYAELIVPKPEDRIQTTWEPGGRRAEAVTPYRMTAASSSATISIVSSEFDLNRNTVLPTVRSRRTPSL